MSSSHSNKEWVLVSKPTGLPQLSNWKLQDVPYPTLSAGQILLKSLWVSVDPYLRGKLNRDNVGEPTVSGTVAEVVESQNAEYKAGEFVTAHLPWRQYVALTPVKETGIRKVDPKWAPISTAVGVLGMPGLTAYFGLFDVAQFKPTDVVVVSGAAGAVGSLVGQLAKLKGATVIGTAGGDKVEYLKTLGFDYTIDYKKHKTADAVTEELKKAAPNGVDVYFDNTGGAVTEAIWPLLNKFARVAICGQISMYNEVSPPQIPAFLHHLIYKGVTVKGFVVSDFAAQFGRFYAEVPKLLQEKKIQYQETVVDGFDKLPEAFIGLFHGANTGKAVVKV